jgi:hypothetical protein
MQIEPIHGTMRTIGSARARAGFYLNSRTQQYELHAAEN